MEPSNGSDVIPRRARPGLAGLGPHIEEVLSYVEVVLTSTASNDGSNGIPEVLSCNPWSDTEGANGSF